MTHADRLQKYLNLFARDKTNRGHQPRANTRKAYRLQLERLCYALDSNEIEFSPLGLKDYLLKLDATSSQSNVNQAATALKAYLNYLYHESVIEFEFIGKFDLSTKNLRRQAKPDESPGNEPRFFSRDELERILYCLSQDISSIPQRDRDIAFFGCILAGPTRAGDLRRATIGGVTFHGATSYTDHDGTTKTAPSSIWVALSSSQTKDWERKSIPIFAGRLIGKVEIYRHLKSYYDWRLQQPRHEPDDPLFTATRGPTIGEPISERTTFKRMEFATRKAGIHATPHKFRRTLGELGGGLLTSRDAAQIFGHSDERTTQKAYTNLDNPERMLAAHLRIADALNR